MILRWFTLFCVSGLLARAAAPEIPVVDGEWWTIASNPDLGPLTSERQEPVDFAIWQAADGTWQLWSCIRRTNCDGKTRLFYGWEGKNLTDPDWRPLGIVMQADPALGETAGGLQAPHVIKVDGLYHMLYGDWERICLATSRDGKKFERYRNERGQPDLFAGPFGQTRDPMVLKVGHLFLCYYTGHLGKDAPPPSAAIFCRTSADLRHWSEPTMVSAGGAGVPLSPWAGGDAECPFVVERAGMFYLFRNHRYGPEGINSQFASANPFDFGVNDDRHFIGKLPVAAPEIVEHDGHFFIAATLPNLKGIRLARLKWVSRN